MNQKTGKKLGLRWTGEGFPPAPLAATSQREAEAQELVRFKKKLPPFFYSHNKQNERELEEFRENISCLTSFIPAMKRINQCW